MRNLLKVAVHCCPLGSLLHSGVVHSYLSSMLPTKALWVRHRKHGLRLCGTRGLHMISGGCVRRRKLGCLSATPIRVPSCIAASGVSHHQAWLGHFTGHTRCLGRVRLWSRSRELNYRRFRCDNLRRWGQFTTCSKLLRLSAHIGYFLLLHLLRCVHSTICSLSSVLLL